MTTKKFLWDILCLGGMLLALRFGYDLGRIEERQARDPLPACEFNVDSIMQMTTRWGKPITPRRVK